MLETGEINRLIARNISDLEMVAAKVIQMGKSFNIWRFEGEMGAGKTTLIREICNQLGVEDNVNSPSFGLVNEYLDQSGDLIYHFDFYRIDELEEAEKIGVGEYFYSGNLCLIEWPEKIHPLIPSRCMVIDIQIKEDQQREIYLKKYE